MAQRMDPLLCGTILIAKEYLTMDYSNVVKVFQSTSEDQVNTYLATQRWIILSIAPGQREDRRAYQLFALGWLGPYDPEFPENDTSEFPE